MRCEARGLFGFEVKLRKISFIVIMLCCVYTERFLDALIFILPLLLLPPLDVSFFPLLGREKTFLFNDDLLCCTALLLKWGVESQSALNTFSW